MAQGHTAGSGQLVSHQDPQMFVSGADVQKARIAQLALFLGLTVTGQDFARAFAERHQPLSAHCDELSLNSSLGLRRVDSFPQFDLNCKLVESSGA